MGSFKLNINVIAKGPLAYSLKESKFGIYTSYTSVDRQKFGKEQMFVNRLMTNPCKEYTFIIPPISINI